MPLDACIELLILVNFFIIDNHKYFLSQGIFNEAETMDYLDTLNSMQSSFQKAEASNAGRIDQIRSGMNKKNMMTVVIPII